MRKPSPTLTPQQLEIMKVVWSRDHATVRDVYEDMLEERKIAYTTVMTMMNVLEKKGHLKKKAEGRSFLYRPTRPQRQVVGSMVRTVPAGCAPVNYGGMVYQQCGGTWYAPQGAQFVVVNPPY